MEKIRGRLIKKYPVKLINDTLYVWLQDNRMLKIRRWRWDKSGSVYVKYTIQHNNELLFTINLAIALEGDTQTHEMWSRCRYNYGE